MGKVSDHIRVRPQDKKKWKDYCEGLKTTSPELFTKVMQSPNLKLNEKVLEELQKQESDMRRKLGLK